jgi:hypothetical protein
MMDRARTGMVCLLAGLALVGCGANGKPRAVARTTTASVPTPVLPTQPASARAHTFISPPADAIVTMRRFSPVSLMWQSIFVQPDGHGLLTSLIGETAGAPHRAFRLSASQLATLRRLIAAAKSVKPGPSKSGDYLYTLHIPGEAQFSFEGPMPRRLTALVNFLDGLTLTYCC